MKPEDWIVGVPWIIIALFILFGIISYTADRIQRTPEPCTLACER